MHPQAVDRDGDPQAKAAAGADVAEDRRRAGRREIVNPQLLPLLRGQVDPNAPADPEIGKPGKLSLDRELASGAVFVATLLLVGAALRFVV